MNAGKAVYGILSANSTVTNIVSTRIFPEIAEQEAATPFVVYQLQSVDPEDTHDGPSKLDEVRFEFMCYADTYNEAADLATAVRGALDRVSGTYNGVNIESVQFNDVDTEVLYDPRRYSQVLTFTFRVKRDDIEIALGTPVTGAVLNDLSDVNVTGVTDNQILSYDAATRNWIAADDAGGLVDSVNGQTGTVTLGLDDLTDVDAGAPTTGQLLAYGQGDWTTISQDEITIGIENVTGLQAELNTIPANIRDLDDVTIAGPTSNQLLQYNGTAWVNANLNVAQSLDDLTDVDVADQPANGALLQYNSNLQLWQDSGSNRLPTDGVYYHDRYQSTAESLRAGATATTELYYAAQADGDGFAESASSDTPTTGYDIQRKLYYSEAAFADPDTGTWIQFAAIADNTTFANAKAALLAYLKERTGGTVPISLKQTWEEVQQAPSFTGLLNESYGSGAAAAYSVRRLNGLYTGAAIEVERSSDNGTQDIGFDSNGDLDESALTTFCTGTTCRVRTWYDQSVTGGTGSGNDAVQTDHALQPTIYTGGAIVKKQGRVALHSDDSTTYQSMTGSISGIATTFTHFAAMQPADIKIGRVAVYRINSTIDLYDNGRIYEANGVADTAVSPAFVAGSYYVHSLDRKSGEVVFYGNGVQIGQETGAAPSNTYSSYRLLSSGNSTSNTYDGYVSELLFFGSSKTSDRTDIESNIGDYFTQNTPLLDTYSGAAAAYSLRKLRTAYTGSAIRVRRASDNAEQDIGFNVFGELDTVSLAAFCSGTNGFVKTWYDQSGSANDATQTTAADQPKIYDSVTGVVTDNGKPAVEFDGSNDFLQLPFSQGALGAFHYVSVVTPSTTAQFQMIVDFRDANDDGTRVLLLNDANVMSSADTADATAPYTATQQIITSEFDGTDLTSIVNGTAGTSVTGASTNATINGRISSQSAVITQLLNGGIQELLIYFSDQSTNRTNIEDNLNTFYNVY